MTLLHADQSPKESYHLWKMITELNKRPGPWMGWKSHWKKKDIWQGTDPSSRQRGSFNAPITVSDRFKTFSTVMGLKKGCTARRIDWLTDWLLVAKWLRLWHLLSIGLRIPVRFKNTILVLWFAPKYFSKFSNRFLRLSMHLCLCMCRDERNWAFGPGLSLQDALHNLLFEISPSPLKPHLNRGNEKRSPYHWVPSLFPCILKCVTLHQ
jgi:hypothetical protein